MLVSIMATDADRADAHPHYSRGRGWVSLEVRSPVGEPGRTATLSMTPAVARAAAAALFIALYELDRIIENDAAQRAAVGAGPHPDA